MTTEAIVRVQKAVLAAQLEAIFVALGVSPSDARKAAEVLVYADLHGIDSHGVQFQVKGVYVPGLRSGSIVARPEEHVLRDGPTTAVIEAGGGLGHPASDRAMRRAIGKARRYGSGFVAVRGSTHFGAAGYYARLAAQAGMVGLAMTNAPPRVLPTFGRVAVVGTNPIAIAAPGGGSDPVLIDIATSSTSAGKLFLAQRSGRRIPDTWAADSAGDPTTDPARADGARLLPLGGASATGGHKGYALAVAVDIFAGLLSGAGYSAMLERPVVGHFFGAWEISRFAPLDAFRDMADQMSVTLRSTLPINADQTVLVPGDPERLAFADRSVNGIPLPRSVLEYLASTARELGVTVHV